MGNKKPPAGNRRDEKQTGNAAPGKNGKQDPVENGIKNNTDRAETDKKTCSQAISVHSFSPIANTSVFLLVYHKRHKKSTQKFKKNRLGFETVW